MTIKRDTKTNGLRILVVDLEPTPYKADLWNAFSDSNEVQISVIYTEQKNWAPDGGHNYLKWPDLRHEYAILNGFGLLGRLHSAMFVASKIFRSQADLIFIAGYDRLATIIAILCALINCKRFVVHGDVLNNMSPSGRLAWLKLILRESLRKVILLKGDAVLVCGRRGVESAIQAGFSRKKILDFPYVIDVERIKLDEPVDIPVGCLDDLENKSIVLFFSGRMIPRKGLSILLEALSRLEKNNQEWVIWIEGSGPEMLRYQELTRQMKLDKYCRFLGFCQYDVHSWLIRNSNIVVVPSTDDPWGIIVDEGMQLGKAVIASDATGSGYDRVDHGMNGYLFKSGSVEQLARQVLELINDYNLRNYLGSNAASSSKNLRPIDNLENLLQLIRSGYGLTK